MRCGLRSASGFSLVEVIATVLVTAILGAIFINFMGTSMSRSVRSMEMVQGEADAESVLERITADFVLKMNQSSGTALDLMEKAINVQKLYGATVSARYVSYTNGVEDGTAANQRTLKVTVAASGNDLIVLLAQTRNPNSPPVLF
jgi:hypothetical protein